MLARGRGRVPLALASALVAALLLVGCNTGVSPKEVALRATVEALRDELSQARAATPAPQTAAKTATPAPAEPPGSPISTVAAKEWWVANHRATTFWSASSGGKVQALVPQWSYFLVMEPQVGSRLHLFLPGGQRNSYVGDGWVESNDVGPVARPPAGAVDAATLPKEKMTPATPVVPKSTPVPGTGSLLLNWQDVGERSQVGDLELVANALLLGQESYGGPYGSRISAGTGTKIVLADMSLRYGFRPGVPPTETHVDFFVIGDSSGLEYRGLPVPVANALPDRFFLSPGQAFRGVVAFIVPKEMKTARLYFTNFLGGKDPPERLTVYLKDIP